MHSIHSAVSAGEVTPKNDEARSTPHAAGSRAFQNAGLHCNDNEEHCLLLEVIPNPFNRLARKYRDLGYGLYPLSGDTLLLTHPAMGMTRTLADMRAAQMLLRQLGGGQ
ncbi:hypothetical protein [Rhodoferax sp. GW822-FHT02A01]|uniref:hypothetical protein n=1 Tax=Rhodoferax sp. GW822-FHT02A01 TaxID=3141537 RepID=UPI00315CE512